MTTDAGEIEVDERRKREDREKELDDLRAVLDLPQGRRLLWRYLGLAGVFKNPHAADSHQTSFFCGQQAIGQTLLSDITTAQDEALILMMREAAAESQRRKVEAEKELREADAREN